MKNAEGFCEHVLPLFAPALITAIFISSEKEFVNCHLILIRFNGIIFKL